MPITATGIGSGLDVESLVSQLILADVQPAENRLNTQRGILSSAADGLRLGKERVVTISGRGR